MRVPIKISGKQYIITGDAHQYIVNALVQRDGVEELKPVSFYSSMSAMFTALMHMKIRASEAETLKDLRNAIDQAEQEIMTAFDLDKRGAVLANRVELDMAT